ncbi:MAG: MerR family transcriptional regulator [Acidobacteria bacterium]|nr:MAG: MerR family transcriptional regulator [Acidobacteriota bacterium]
MSKYPKKLFYKIGEVCDICGVEAHVLRYWESEFSALAPTRNKSGQRIYRLKDLEIIDTIKRLLYQEGYTIAGAGRRLLEQGLINGQEFPLLRKRKVSPAETLAQIKGLAQEILQILDKAAERSSKARSSPTKLAAPATETEAAPGTQLIMSEILLPDAQAGAGKVEKR